MMGRRSQGCIRTAYNHRRRGVSAGGMPPPNFCNAATPNLLSQIQSHITKVQAPVVQIEGGGGCQDTLCGACRRGQGRDAKGQKQHL